jgi:hypothetical protein
MCLLTTGFLQYTFLILILNSRLFIVHYLLVLIFRLRFYFAGLGYYFYGLSIVRTK